MITHLTAESTLTFVPESEPDDDTLTRSNFDDAIALSTATRTATTFVCRAHLNVIGQHVMTDISLTPGNDNSGASIFAVFLRLNEGQKFPDWIKPKQVVSVKRDDGDNFSGIVRFRRGRSFWAKETKKGPDFFIQEGVSR